MTTTLENANHGKQRKRNKNSRFMRNAKGFGKKGIFGRGTRIDDDQYNYFINILDAMKAGFEDTEEKATMADNVFASTADQEVHMASNQIVSKALESLIGFVQAEHLESFFVAFGKNLRPLCSDRYASHVLQKMVEIAFLRGIGKSNLKPVKDEEPSTAKRAKLDTKLLNEEQYNLETEFKAAHKEQCCDFVLRVSKFVLNNLEDFVWDACASHIMRTCVLSLAGVYIPKTAFEKKGADLSRISKVFTVPAAWLEVMQEFPQRLSMWPQFSDFPYQEHSSALIGVICIALKMTDKNQLKHFGKQLLMQALLRTEKVSDDKKEDEKDIVSQAVSDTTDTTAADTDKASLPMVFLYQSSVRLLETLLTVAGPKLQTQLYAMLFCGRLPELAKDQLTNFAVQKLLQVIKDKKDFEQIFSELSAHTEDILKIGHTGVIAAISAACLRLGTSQAQFIAALQTALHVSGDKEKAKQFFQCLTKLKPYEIVLKEKDKESNFVHLHGSLIVQDILRFNKPIFLVNCILETPADQLVAIFNTPNGSHIVDAFLDSKFIGEKSREKLLRLLEGSYIDLAVSKFGSRVVECCFNVAQEAQKTRIVKELAGKTNLLKGTPFGRLVYNNLNVNTYQLSPQQWKVGLQKKENKVHDLFKDIIR